MERIDRITDPLKRIEIFKAITSPAYIVATLENVNDVSSEFFCPVKKCFEFACEASAKAKATPEYKREYAEIEYRYCIDAKVPQYGHEKSNESVKNMDGTFAGWSGMV